VTDGGWGRPYRCRDVCCAGACPLIGAPAPGGADAWPPRVSASRAVAARHDPGQQRPPGVPSSHGLYFRAGHRFHRTPVRPYLQGCYAAGTTGPSAKPAPGAGMPGRGSPSWKSLPKPFQNAGLSSPCSPGSSTMVGPKGSRPGASDGRVCSCIAPQQLCADGDPPKQDELPCTKGCCWAVVQCWIGIKDGGLWKEVGRPRNAAYTTEV